MRPIVTFVPLAGGIPGSMFVKLESVGAGMRTTACILAVMALLWCRPLPAEQLSPKYCVAFAEQVQDTESTIDQYIADTTRNNMIVDLAGATEGKVRGTATDASNAYSRFLQAARDYRLSLDKLERLLRSCPPG